MQKLDKKDLTLITQAQKVIEDNYDEVNFNHTVGAAVRCKSGNIYVGVNVYSLHGACAEQIAIGAAITNGERDFECIVAVRGKQGQEILVPCGNCRQMLSDYAPQCQVIVEYENGICKVSAIELLPFAYQVES
ncbi:cytidine deaminase [Vallitalea guaymasensis]|uniref:cytidine deaminase n=1 Tax=Vallitalea guaymasensis TaxID=1185412 RepID=UPI0023571D37|nr:cytidine deaminase [Vallitalea guaymasensis]